MMAIEAVVKDCRQHMRKALDYLTEELMGIRTGRASPGLVEHLKVNVAAYGSSMDLRELAAVSAPEPALLIVKPYDPNVTREIEKAIQASNLGLTPMVDGSTIRLPIPVLTGDRRRQLSQEIKRMAEAQKVAVRNARRDANKQIDTLEKSHEISEDDAAEGKNRVQELTREFEHSIDEQSTNKQKEVEAV